MIVILVDSSYIVALGYKGDKHHTRATELSTQADIDFWIPDVVLIEALFNLQRLGGTYATIEFAELLIQETPNFVHLDHSAFVRAMELMRKYRDAELDFVDCYLTALAERLNITRICTFDHRDFSIIRPKHIDYLELLP